MENSDILILDGAMGTMLQAAGLKTEELPETWNITHPERVAEIHRRYLEAGSRVLYTNTFGANRRKAAGCGYTPAELIRGAVRCAREAAGTQSVKIALDIGPIGQLLEPLGDLGFEEAYDIFREMVTAGEEAGADLVVFETMSDLYEVKAAVLAAKENTKLPVWTTMTFEANGRSFLGVTVPAMALTLTGLGVDALGFNCSLGPKELLPMAEELREWTDLPLILKPNAGLPDPATGEYRITPAEFAAELRKALPLGVFALGGCCGTTPDFIRTLCETLECAEPAAQKAVRRHGVCCAVGTAEMSGVRVVGERINPTGKKRFQQALRERDFHYIVRQGIEQQDAGAEILDVNVGLPGVDEVVLMRETVKALQAAVDLPLQIDSSDPAAIEVGLRVYNGKAIVNSVNGRQEVLEAVLPLCKKYGAAVVGLCMDENGIPRTAAGRVEIAERILRAAESYGIPQQDVYIDCLTLTVSAQQEQAMETLKAVQMVKETLGLHTTLGVSNISFGLPAREIISASFLSQALYAGLDIPIINPNQSTMMDAVAAFRALSGQDGDCEDYIRRFSRAKTPGQSLSKTDRRLSIQEAILRGLGRETALLTEEALREMDELAVIERLLIPALDEVGDRYERQELFLPQLIKAANAACVGFELIKKRIACRGGQTLSRGKILLATVQGDIHDIGKNIVKVVLENYGYTVLDLGRDVPPKRIVETAVRENVHLVGLSALMTTTVPSMAETIAQLRQSGHSCKIMVGGAVLTPEYADEIGADFYAKDAKQSADIAKQVLG